jgi:predicted small lipoprotein YifL
MKRLTLFIAVLASLLLFSGCGQSGPLYIPGNPSQMAVPPSQDTAKEDEQEDSSDESADSN